MGTIDKLQHANDAGSGFSPTLPPLLGPKAPLPPDAEALPLPHDAARLLFPLGIKGLRASMIDIESMACRSSWSVGEADKRSLSPDGSGGAGFPVAMATIVHLNKLPFDQTLTRQLDPQHWAFAWRVDEHRVAVAEARYRLPANMRSELDTAVVRRLCTAGIGAGELRPDEAAPGRLQRVASDGLAAAAAPLPAPKPTPATLAGKLAQRLRWPPLLALGLAAAVCLVAALQIESSRLGQARHLVSLTDTTMAQQLTRVLAAGDYGEVQADLEAFEGLGYFKGAVVVDARRRAVASAGAVPALRIGHALTGTDIAVARTVPLLAGAGNSEGQLLVWGLETTSPAASAIERALFAAGLLLMLATLAGTAFVWWRR